QATTGGWAPSAADNNSASPTPTPFPDRGALLAPPTADVTGRCLGMLAQLGETRDSPRVAAAIAYLMRTQMKEGSWYGRWGMNYIYGTWSVLAGLNAAGVDPQSAAGRRAGARLGAIHDGDDGWGAGGGSYQLAHQRYHKTPR